MVISLNLDDFPIYKLSLLKKVCHRFEEAIERFRDEAEVNHFKQDYFVFFNIQKSFYDMVQPMNRNCASIHPNTIGLGFHVCAIEDSRKMFNLLWGAIGHRYLSRHKSISTQDFVYAMLIFFFRDECIEKGALLLPSLKINCAFLHNNASWPHIIREYRILRKNPAHVPQQKSLRRVLYEVTNNGHWRLNGTRLD